MITVIQNCKYCGKSFEVPARKVKIGAGKYCSKQCQHQSRKVRILRTCKICGKSFETTPGEVKRGSGIYCSRDCYYVFNRQKTVSVAVRERISKSKTGVPNLKIRGENHPCYGKHLSEETRLKIGRKGEASSWFGKHHTKQSKELIGKANGGKNNHFWKGGITPLGQAIRSSTKYAEWVSAVFTRDKFTCQDSGVVGGRLEAHHIKPFAQILEENHITTINEALACAELWDVSNGITLSIKSHKRRHSRK